MPPWPAWDWLPSGHRGVTLTPQHWDVAVRKKSHRPLPVPGKGLLPLGLPSGEVPTAWMPATAAASLTLLSSEPGGAGRVGRRARRLFVSSSRVLCPTLWGLAGRFPSRSRGSFITLGVAVGQRVGDLVLSLSALGGCCGGHCFSLLSLWSFMD